MNNPILDSIMAERKAEQQEAPVEQSSQKVIESQEETEDNSEVEGQIETNEAGDSEDTKGDESVQDTEDLADSKDWFEDDDDSSPEAVEKTDSLITLGKAIGLDNTDPKEIADEVTRVFNQNKELQQQLELSKVSDPILQEAINVANTGGDYLSLLGVRANDWSEAAISDEQLLINAELLPIADNNYEVAKEMYDKMDPTSRKLMASRIRKELIGIDNRKADEIKKKALDNKIAIDKGVKSILDDTHEVYGVKLTPAMKKEAYNDIIVKDFFKKFLQDDKGNISPKKMVEAAILLKNPKLVVKTAVNKARGAGIKEVLDEASNPVVSKKGQTPRIDKDKPVNSFESFYQNITGG